MQLILKPTSTRIADAVQRAWENDYPQYLRSKPPRRFKHEYRTRHKNANAELVRESIANKVEYQLLLKPQDLLIGKHTFSSSFQALILAPWAIGVFKAALKNFLPSLDDDELASWEDDNFRMSHVTINKYLKFDTEAEAMEALWTLFMHCKVILDSEVVFPKRKGQSTVPAPKVFADETRRNAFRIVLPAGEITVYIIRDDAYPATLQDVNETDQRMAMRASIRTLLCFEMTNDLAKFRYVDEDGLVRSLPDDFTKWTRDYVARDPNKLFWDQARYDFWLNVELATTEKEVRREGLSHDRLKVLDAYLAGQSMLTPYLLADHNDAMVVHEALVRKAGVNIWTPWAVNKLHKGKTLRPMTDENNLFDLGADAGFKAHTLCKDNVKEAIKDFSVSMVGVPGWSFEPPK